MRGIWQKKQGSAVGKASWLSLLLLTVLVLLAGGCSSASDEADSAPQEMAAPAAEPGAGGAEALSMTAASQSSQSAAGQSGAAGETGGSPAAVPSASAGDGSAAMADSAGAAAGAGNAQAGEMEEGIGAQAGIGPIADAAGGYNRKMIYTANVTMKVESFAEGEERVANAIFQTGGYIVQFADSQTNGRAGSTYVIKVPSSGFSSFLDELKQIPHLSFERQMEGNDVSEEYVDLEARLKANEALEARLLSFMDKATNSDDLVHISNEVARVQQTIEQIKGRMRYLDQNVAYSTVNLRLYEGAQEAEFEENEGASLGERLSAAMEGSARVLRAVGESLLTFLAALLPVLLVIAIVAVPAFFVVRRSRAVRNHRSAEKRKRLNADKMPSDAELAEQPAPADTDGGEESR